MSSSENTAKDSLYESVSALCDGEASELELRRLLKSEDEEVTKRWERYHLASSAIKKETISLPAIDLSAAISEQIAVEETYSVKSANKPNKVWAGLGRFSIAASVAGALVLGVQFLPSQDQGVNTVAEVSPAPVAGAPVLAPNTSVRAVSQETPDADKPQIIISEATQEQLESMSGEINRLMLEHAQHATQNTQQGVLPYVRVPDSEQ